MWKYPPRRQYHYSQVNSPIYWIAVSDPANLPQLMALRQQLRQVY
jgi:hypothetical protein